MQMKGNYLFDFTFIDNALKGGGGGDDLKQMIFILCEILINNTEYFPLCHNICKFPRPH